MPKTVLTTIVGTPSEKNWSQAQGFVTETGLTGSIVLCLQETAGSDVIELAPIGADLIEAFRGSLETVTNTTQLNEAIEKITHEIASGVIVSVILGLVSGEELIVAGVGDIAAYLVRGQSLVRLGNKETLNQGLSGKLVSGDVLCLATQELVNLFGESDLAERLKEGSRSIESMAPKIHMQSDSSMMAAVIAEHGELYVANEGERENMGGIAEKLSKVFVRPLRVKREGEEPRKLNMYIAYGALIFLIVMIAVGYLQRIKVVAQKEYQSVSSQVDQSLSEAKSVADLNPERAKTLLSQSLQVAKAYSEKVTKEPYKTNALKMVAAIEQAQKEVFKVDSISLKPFIELDVLAQGLKSNKFYTDLSGNLIFPDKSKPRVVGMSIADKSMFSIDTSEVGVVKSIGFFDKNYFGVSDKGIVQFTQSKPEMKVAIEGDPLWGEIAQVYSYAGNIYLFDRGNSEIWKYPVIKDGYGERRRWLGAGITLDLSKVADMKISGDVWLITESGKLERYSRGVPVEFSMEGFPAVNEAKRLVDPAAIYITDDEVYVLERGADRVVVFGQDGKYKSQYVSEEFSRASDLAIYKGKGYVMIDNVVKEFGL